MKEFFSEHKALRALLFLACFLFCMWLIISGQKVIGPSYLARMLIGLAGLLGLLYLYNRPYRG